MTSIHTVDVSGRGRPLSYGPHVAHHRRRRRGLAGTARRA